MSPRGPSRQSTGLESVLAAIARTAARLCEASDALIYLVEGDHHRLVAKHGRIALSQRLGGTHAIRNDTPLGQAVLTGRPVHVQDLRVAVRTRFRGLAELGFYNPRVRTTLAMPLLRDREVLGGIIIQGTRVRQFSSKQIALLETFAAQASIAIENARLSQDLGARNRELTEALEQQTATAEILQVISSSPTNLQPVLDTIARSAAVVCGADDATVLLLEDGIVRVTAHYGPIARSVPEGRPLARTFASGRSIVDRRPVHIRDIMGPDGDDFAPYRTTAQQTGYRSLVAVPLLRGSDAIGSLSIRNHAVRPFTDKQIALVKIFADQAVIAIENVRLFTELQGQNRALTEALEQQTATSEILNVISSSPTDTQPVFDAVIENAVRLCGALYAVVWRYEGDWAHVVAHYNIPPEQLEGLRRLSLNDHPIHRVVRTGQTLDAPDVEQLEMLP
ncbi:MAG: GAF domain-containing protein, partial [Gaiellales bacterium]